MKRETFVAAPRPARPAGPSPELQRMAGQVKEVLPRVPVATIITDLSESTAAGPVRQSQCVATLVRFHCSVFVAWKWLCLICDANVYMNHFL